MLGFIIVARLNSKRLLEKHFRILNEKFIFEHFKADIYNADYKKIVPFILENKYNLNTKN